MAPFLIVPVRHSCADFGFWFFFPSLVRDRGIVRISLIWQRAGRWQLMRAGREEDYHGIAIHPKHLWLSEALRPPTSTYQSKIWSVPGRLGLRGEKSASEKKGGHDDERRKQTMVCGRGMCRCIFEKRPAKSRLIRGNQKASEEQYADDDTSSPEQGSQAGIGDGS